MFKPVEIGRIITAYDNPEGTPIQTSFSSEEQAEVHFYEQFREGLSDLGGFSHIWLITWLDRSKPFTLKVIPYRDTVHRGIFATRSPNRPNPIALSSVELVSVDINTGIVIVKGVDFLNNTPLLDIKPYIPADMHSGIRTGWFNKGVDRRTADNRFNE